MSMGFGGSGRSALERTAWQESGKRVALHAWRIESEIEFGSSVKEREWELEREQKQEKEKERKASRKMVKRQAMVVKTEKEQVISGEKVLKVERNYYYYYFF